MNSENKKDGRSKKSKILMETAGFGARALASGFLTGMGLKLGSQFVEKVSSSRKLRASVSDLRKRD